MKNRTEIGVIAPDRYLVDLVNRVKKEFSEPMVVKLADQSESIVLAEQFLKQGVRVLVSRGGNTIKIRQGNFPIPVIDIPINGYDIIKLLDKARRISNEVAVIGFDTLISGAQFIGNVLEIKITSFLVKSESEFPLMVKNASDMGFKVMIGGKTPIKYAKKFGMHGIPIKSQKSTIRNSLNEAINLLEGLRREREWGGMLQNILDLINDGIIAVDQSGKIAHVNKSIELMFQRSGKELVGKPILNFIKESDITKVIQKGKQFNAKIQEFNKVNYAINSAPILIDQKVRGAIITAQKIDHIQALERNIRKKLYQKGLIAKYTFDHLIGKHYKFEMIIKKAENYAKSDSTILIQGESGTGKEMFAQSIHNESTRKNGPFVAINCTALPENLLESELFGYVEGAFTGAKRGGKSGLFELAHRGTLFLDEIGELSKAVQGRLLRFLEEKQIMRIGDDKLIPVDVRVICATNRNIKDLVKTALFREDLFYRINVLKLELPPLREKKEDIPRLVESFVNSLSRKFRNNSLTISEEEIHLLMTYHWPGNIRELKNVIERLVIASTGRTVSRQDVEDAMGDLPIWQADPEPKEKTENKPLSLAQKEEFYLIRNVLFEAKGNKVKASNKLGISRTTLWRKMKRYGDYVNIVS
jgi:PAS domain S-box-containing protein